MRSRSHIGVLGSVHRCACAGAQVRWMNVNQFQQRRATEEFNAAPKMTSYDIDKEKWGKQTQWHTMDCILDPSIEMPKKLSYKGARKNFSMWLLDRKIKERRPSFEPLKELRQLYLEYKEIATTPAGNQQRDLCKVTTWTEAVRIEEETRKLELETEEREAARTGKAATKSWKDLSVKKSSAGAALQKKAPAARAGKKLGDQSESKDKRPSNDDEVVPDVATPLLEVRVDDFEVINMYMGSMTNDDWLQVTVKVTGKQRTPKTAPLFESFVEFPVFETKLGDGVQSSNTHPFRVVAVMDRDGTRYGKDGTDAAQLRKAMSQAKTSWFGM